MKEGCKMAYESPLTIADVITSIISLCYLVFHNKKKIDFSLVTPYENKHRHTIPK